MRLDILGRPIRRKKRNCVNGHAMTPENTGTRSQQQYIKTTGETKSFTFRFCRECSRIAVRLSMRRARGNVMTEGRV